MQNVADLLAAGNTPRASMALPNIVLRDYQERGVAQAREAFRSRVLGRPPAVLIVGPTGGGKGILAAYLLAEAAKKGNRSLFIVHRREIIKDTAKRIQRLGAPCGVILADEDPVDPDAPIQCCSIQTLFARGTRPPADFIFWDECHHCVADSYRLVREAYPHAKHLGASATPMRADRSALGDVFDVMIVIATTRELTETIDPATGRTYLVPCVTIAPSEFLGSNLAQDPVDAYEAHGEDERAFVFVDRKLAARELARRFNERGFPAVSIDANTPAAHRTRCLEMFKDGEIRVLVNVSTMTEGVDIPEAAVCILATKCKTPAVYLQRGGRVLRSCEGKSRAILIDLPGNMWLHGMLADDREFSLKGRAIVNAEKKENTPVPCPAMCGAVARALAFCESGPGCPKCGYKKQPAPPPEILGLPLHVFGQLTLPFYEAAQ